MGEFKHPTSAGETSRMPSESRHAGQPASPARDDAPGPPKELPAEWEDPWIDLGGEG